MAFFSIIRAMTSLYISDNRIGKLVPPHGWSADDGDGQAPWVHTDGRRVEEGMPMPEGSMPQGVVAIADAIPAMGALENLNSSKNDIGGYWESGRRISNMMGIKALAAAIPHCK